MDYLPVIPIGNTGKSQANFHLGDNMVLQQQSEVIFRGKASANKQIVAIASWNQHKVTTRSDQEGNWKLKLPLLPQAVLIQSPFRMAKTDAE
ncbi:hypothetical protein NXX48_24415 [Bacteroides faecis]|nr:hypothetical protein [Bacteroides faecis]